MLNTVTSPAQCPDGHLSDDKFGEWREFLRAEAWKNRCLGRWQSAYRYYRIDSDWKVMYPAAIHPACKEAK